MATRISKIEGIGPAMSERLEQAGVKTVEGLLTQGATRNGRRMLAEQSGLDEQRILKWVNMADLFRIKGVGEEYADLLEQAGVDTVKELRTRNAANLHNTVVAVNQQKKLVRKEPTLSQLESFIAQANTLNPVIEY